MGLSKVRLAHDELTSRLSQSRSHAAILCGESVAERILVEIV